MSTPLSASPRHTNVNNTLYQIYLSHIPCQHQPPFVIFPFSCLSFKEMIAAARDMPASMSTEASSNAQKPGPAPAKGGGTIGATVTASATTTAAAGTSAAGVGTASTTSGASASASGGLSVSSSELLQLFAGGATASMTINGTVTSVR